MPYKMSGNLLVKHPRCEEACRELEARGCQVVVWEGKGGDCYMRDPFGLTFNLWEDPLCLLTPPSIR